MGSTSAIGTFHSIMKLHTFLSLPTIVLFLLLGGCAQKPAEEEIDFGEIKDSVYRNNYFGLSLTLPQDWIVQNREFFKKTIEVGAEAITGTDENMKVAFDAAKLNIVPLFAVSKHEAGAPVDSNPNINTLAERIHLAPGIKKGTDYLFHTRKFMEGSAMKFTFPSETQAITIGGREFGVMEVEMNMGPARLKQKHYATVLKGYALQFVITYTKEEELPILEQVIHSSKFD
jgi:hypothetical protein